MGCLSSVMVGAFRSKYCHIRPMSFLGAKEHSNISFKNLESMLDSFEHEPVLLSFTSGHCGPCKIQNQELAALAHIDGSLRMLKIDLNHFPQLGPKFHISKLPCTVVMMDKKVALRVDRLITAQDLWDQVQLIRLNPKQS
jgi:thioredoxin-like negative regulator of GroEL